MPSSATFCVLLLLELFGQHLRLLALSLSPDLFFHLYLILLQPVLRRHNLLMSALYRHVDFVVQHALNTFLKQFDFLLLPLYARKVLAHFVQIRLQVAFIEFSAVHDQQLRFICLGRQSDIQAFDHLIQLHIIYSVVVHLVSEPIDHRYDLAVQLSQIRV